MNPVERLQNALSIDSANRFYIVYGIGVEDSYIGLDYTEMNIEQALLQSLHHQGIKRVAFISPHKPVYYLDRYSAASCSPKRQVAEARPSYQPERMQSLSGGPLNNRFLYKTAAAPQQPNGFSGMGDVHSMRMLDSLLREKQSERTAIIFLQAETVLRYFGDTRTMAGIIGEWARLPSDNTSLVIFVFSAARYDDLCQVAQQLPVPEVRNRILRRSQNPGQSDGLVNLGGPDDLEILRLLRRVQQIRKLSVNEPEMIPICQWMAAEGNRLRDWAAKLEKVDQLSIELARQKGWFSSSLNPSTTAAEQLNQLVGLEPIKRRIQELTAWLIYQRSHEAAQPTSRPLLHMVFMGNPGTGKTTIARLTGELFHEIGLLKRGHLVEAHAADLVADFVGGTAIKTNQVIDQALDGVLFIDEAYTLSASDRGGFGQEAIDTLLTRLEDDRNRLVVIVAGYPQKMRQFIQSNPGLKRRFPLENHFEFPDYTPEELGAILDSMLDHQSIPVPAETHADLRRVIHGMYRDRNEQFGNAGEMRNLAHAIERLRAVRIVSNHLPVDDPLSSSDLPSEVMTYLNPVLPEIDGILADLNALTGLARVKQTLTDLYYRLQYDQLRQLDDPTYHPENPIQHMIFTGNPGTGKTTVARLLGRMYKSLGLLRKGHCVEVSRADLVAGYVGQSALKTREVVNSALDGVLFIDEAYSLSRGSENDFGKEAVDFLSQAAVDYRFRLLIIAAGYPKEMEQFLALNPGLASRFGQPIPFLDFSITELIQILLNLIEKNGFILPEPLMNCATQSIRALMRQQGAAFGNARAIHQLFEQMKVNLARRVMNLNQKNTRLSRAELITFQLEDIPYIGFSMDAESPDKTWIQCRPIDPPPLSEQIRQEEPEQSLRHLNQRFPLR